MRKKALLGRRVRRLRTAAGWTQAALARRLGISASYLNLLEHDKRSLTVPLLLELAEILEVDLESFAEDDEARLIADLEEVLADPVLRSLALTGEDLRALASEAPAGARALLHLYRAYRAGRDEIAARAARGAGSSASPGESGEVIERDARIPSEEVSDLIQAHGNHFDALERAALALWSEAELVQEELERGLRGYLHGTLGVRVETRTSESAGGQVRRYDPQARVLELSEVLPRPSRVFQLAHQIGLLTLRPIFDELLEAAPLTTEGSRALARVALANYFAAAVLMPYEPFLAAARSARYDLEILGHRFGASFEQVCHRLTSLSRPGRSGVPFHMIRIDIAGNITKRFSGSGIRFARFSGACPRWNVHAAFLTPGQIRTQLSRMTDGTTYFCIARTVRKAGGGYRVPESRLAIGLGCDVRHARKLVYADGIDLENDQACVPIGTTCRLCTRMDCRQRAFPPLDHALKVDENRRGLSFFYSP